MATNAGNGRNGVLSAADTAKEILNTPGGAHSGGRRGAGRKAFFMRGLFKSAFSICCIVFMLFSAGTAQGVVEDIYEAEDATLVGPTINTGNAGYLAVLQSRDD